MSTRRSNLRGQTCAVAWCVSLALKKSRYCAVHAKHPDLKPMELEPDEELIGGGVPVKCAECKGAGKIDCACCSGHGSARYTCRECGDHAIEQECHKCDGAGTVQCRACIGSGSQNVRKRKDDAA